MGGEVIGPIEQRNVYGHRNNSVGIETDYELDGRGKICLFSRMLRPALGTTQPPLQWLPGVISLG
jgi:hypothetical protein